MKIRAMRFASTVLAIAQMAGAANTPPLSGEWNIAPSGTASSSGELLFRVTPGDGSDATEVTVSVSSGTDETGVANNIRRALNTQLRGDRFDVEAGQGANVLVKSSSKTGFSLELVDSDVESIRVAVQSAQPVAPPTVPRQATPANPPTTTPATPPAPGDAVPPAPGPGEAAPSAPPSGNSAPPSENSAPPSGNSAPPSGNSAPPSGTSTPPSGNSAPPSGPSAPGSSPPRLESIGLETSALQPSPRFRYRFP